MIRQSDREFHGRVTALTFLPFGVQSFTGLGFGLLADIIGEQEVFILMGLAGIVISVVLGLIYLRMKDPSIRIPSAGTVLRGTLRPLAAVMRPQK